MERTEMQRMAVERRSMKVFIDRSDKGIFMDLHRFTRKVTEEDRQLAANYIIRKCGEEVSLVLAMLSLEEKVAA